MQLLQEQPQLFKADVSTSNYHLNVNQNSMQFVSNTPTHSVASLQSTVSRAHPGYQVFEFFLKFLAFFMRNFHVSF